MARLCFFALMQEPDIEMVGAREGRAEDHLSGQAAALHRTGLQRGAHRADMGAAHMRPAHPPIVAELQVTALAQKNVVAGDGAFADGSSSNRLPRRSIPVYIALSRSQYDKGFPENCQDPAPRLDHRLVGAMLDLMPAPRLIYNEWDKHGTCSGLDAKAYFDTVRKARAAVTIPADYADPQAALTVTPGAVEAAFIKANPTLPADGMAVICSGKRVSEVRLCLAKDLKFRACPEVAKRGCRRDLLLMPPVRGNND